MVTTKDTLTSGGTTTVTAPPSSVRYPEDAHPDQIKSDIDRTRAEMDRTIDELSLLLRPRNLLGLFFEPASDGSSDWKRHARDIARKSVITAGRKAIQEIKQHPVPAAMVGAGIAYMLFVEGKEKSPRKAQRGGMIEEEIEYEYATPSETAACYGPVESELESAGAGYPVGASEAPVEPGIAERAGEKSESFKHGVAGAAGAIKDRASRATEYARKQTSRAGQKMKGATAGAAGSVRHAASSAAHGLKDAASGVMEKVRHATSEGSAMIGDLTDAAGHKARQFGHTVRVSASDAGYTLRNKASDLGFQARRGMDHGRRKAAEITDEHPLALGAALLGIGMLVGLALPRTRKEDKLVGEKADELKHRAKSAGKAVVDRGMHAAQRAAEETIDEAKRQGLTPASFKEKVKHAASEMKHAAGEIVEREELKSDQIGEKARHIAEHAKETAQKEFSEEQKSMQESNL